MSARMIELSADNAPDFLRATGHLLPGAVRVAALSGGVSNSVLRVENDTERFVLKQSLPQLRTRAEWFSDLDRIYREQEVMQALEPFLPELVVPKILWAEREHFVFAMSHAPLDAVVWKESLLAGDIDAGRGAEAGRILGIMHETSVRQRPLFETFSDSAVFIQLRVDPFYRRIQQRCPEVSAIVGDVIDQMLSCRDGLCHGDYTPKNILLHDRGFTLVDYETAVLGDPAMDLGLCLTHIFLKAIRRPQWQNRYFEVVRRFWHAYSQEVTSLSTEELQRRGVRHLGVCLLARVDGTSPVDYLDEPQRERVRRLGHAILLSGMRSWQEVERIVSPLAA